MFTILLPPSEGKAPGGDGPGWTTESGRFGHDLAPHRDRVVAAMQRARGGSERLLGVGGRSLERAIAANRVLVGAPTLPASARFTGVVWEHLDPGTLRGMARKRARRSVIVVSALTGLSAIDDPIPDHRLKLSASLAPLGRLSTWWRVPLSEALAGAARGHMIIDLLPQEHRAAWAPDPDVYDHRQVRLVSSEGRTVGHTAKAAKGLLARQLLESDDPERVLGTFVHLGIRATVH